MPSETAAWVEALGVVGSLILSGYALKVAFQQEKKRTELETDLNSKTNALQRQLNEEESTEERRRFFTTLWDKMKDVQEIDTAKPAAAVVRKNLNTLELVALCWQANIIDRKMVFLSFAKPYNLIYEQIKSIQTDIPHLDKTGPELLNEYPSISPVHTELKKMLDDQGTM